MKSQLFQRFLLRKKSESPAISPDMPTRYNGESPASIIPELERINRFSMSGIRVLEKLYFLAQNLVTQNIPGDFVECGVCNGGSAAAVGLAFRQTGRRAWLYDSFEGLPIPKEVDGDFARNYIGNCLGSEENVIEAVAIAKLELENCVIRKGWFKDTFKSPLPSTVALLHIDADWYESVLLALETFYDLVVDGGIVVLDDFGHWEGCREAFYDFVKSKGTKPLLERFGHSQVFWIKGRQNNRDRSEFPVSHWEIPRLTTHTTK